MNSNSDVRCLIGLENIYPTEYTGFPVVASTLRIILLVGSIMLFFLSCWYFHGHDSLAFFTFQSDKSPNRNETNDDRLSKIKKRMIFMTKVILFIICCYAVTPYSNNPKQREYKHTYSDLKFLYFTNQSLYFTVLTVAVGFIYRLKPRLFKLYNTLLPVALTFEIVVTGVFWSPLFR
ncbi:uncharacterized protein VICG_00853 [Vittaforma corneae ATCC 50505]|uniref:Uncharacterized protein n=1 Tax=Vittaforma corneae (strain ATCC 50505) TaxID=993615 RepID=L2GNY5_VITCO|nr:uncharacterized protein VICG_00853 [Vittaforma corneae ATCC 50505]ELA42210.1 hypothetical protein VICG_00853 [Vittaforma corneae ATCC 50505]